MSSHPAVLDDEPIPQTSQSGTPTGVTPQLRPDRTFQGRLDVSDLDVASLERFVSQSVGDRPVSLKRRGGRTYLLFD